jgi:hypothetical protein
MAVGWTHAADRREDPTSGRVELGASLEFPEKFSSPLKSDGTFDILLKKG